VTVESGVLRVAGGPVILTGWPVTVGVVEVGVAQRYRCVRVSVRPRLRGVLVTIEIQQSHSLVRQAISPRRCRNDMPRRQTFRSFLVIRRHPTTTADDRQPVTSYSRSVVTEALSRLVLEIFTKFFCLKDVLTTSCGHTRPR